MKFFRKKKLITIAILALLAFGLGHFTTSDRQVDYSIDVKPIINRKCITCHGGVKAKGGFSLLFREDALAKTESGKYAIVPGKPDESEMIRRINEKDPEERMPYKHERLSDEEISILTRWVKQGAKWGDHWAYLPVKQMSVPEISNDWVINDVDRFIYQKLNEQKLEPSQLADRPTLLRRVSLDLIGMYPSDAVAKKFLTSTDPKAYETLVDSLLASPHFGERWATMWLDLARYADSKGYEADHGREIWKYRDWVIKAYNEDKPYNEFLTEQIAGDLLPNPSDAQYIATAFSRNTMTNDEGGTNNEEFRTAAVLDRVNTTWEALMGTTFACVQCHSHPYDPFRHEEYYSFVAYFNNTRDEDQYPEEFPYLRSYNKEQNEQLEKLVSWVKENGSEASAQKVKLFLKTWQPVVNMSMAADSIKNGYISGNNGELGLHNYSGFTLRKIDLNNVQQLIVRMGARFGGEVTVRYDNEKGPVIGTGKIKPIEGRALFSFPVVTDNKVHDLYFSFTNNAKAATAKDLFSLEWVAFTEQFPGKGKAGYEENKKLFWQLAEAKVETTPIMVENPHTMMRKTHVFERGNRLTLGKEVSPHVPKSLAFAMPANAPADRRGLAMWMTDKRNPLVSRTMVNRLWEQIFGTGIVETLEDFGTQGSLPTHREMLDHYAWKFMNDYKWSFKKLVKEFVMSATYRQNSKTTEELKRRDPANHYYARGPRVRLSAEQLRDQDLCISSLLSDKMYGPGVMPWQPEGIWSNPYNSESWKTSEGEDKYRRAVYTYIKRTGAYPSMISFDGTPRIACTPRRISTNTPLQALVTLNDSAYLDMAAHFAKRMKNEGGASVEQQISKGYEMMLFKKIPVEKLQVLTGLYNQALQSFSQNDSAAVQFTVYNDDEGGTPHNKPKADEKMKQEAALKVVANAMMNLDEVITKN
jgi:mono/diheme cytochrome c family protein